MARLRWACLLAILMSMALPVRSSGTVLAGPIVNPANGHDYYLLDAASWSDSEAEAQTLGGHLVAINDADENQFVYEQFTTFGSVQRALWIGFTDQALEGTFVWASGDSVTYVNWGANEPNNALGDEHFTMMYCPAIGSKAGQWNDLSDEPAFTGCEPAPGVPPNGVVEVEGACGGWPSVGCLTAGKSLLLLKNAGDDSKDKLLWKWVRGAAFTQMDLGDPTSSDHYALCVYAGTASTLIADAFIPPGPSWSGISDKGFKFKGASPDGLSLALLKGGAADKSKALVKGRGAPLPDPTLPLTYPVTVQLKRVGSAMCLESTFTSAHEKKNTETQFKVKQ